MSTYIFNFENNKYRRHAANAWAKWVEFTLAAPGWRRIGKKNVAFLNQLETAWHEHCAIVGYPVDYSERVYEVPRQLDWMVKEGNKLAAKKAAELSKLIDAKQQELLTAAAMLHYSSGNPHAHTFDLMKNVRSMAVADNGNCYYDVTTGKTLIVFYPTEMTVNHENQLTVNMRWKQ